MSTLLSKLKSNHPAVHWAILSGMAALMYQVVLQKTFSYILGGALLSTTIVVAAYMTGLALGGFLTGLFSLRSQWSASSDLSPASLCSRWRFSGHIFLPP